jgi:NAD(P)-dependent dehydrogenase (short-subunit alcohol dehydrogenase family)
VRSFGRVWTTDLKERRIRVNAVNPGPVDTPRLKDLLPSREAGGHPLELTSNRASLRRFGTPEEIAKAVVFLASDDSRHITGTELFVGGGSMSENVHLGRLGTPEDIAKGVAFLASDDSRHITGTELFVGAGFAQLEASAVSTLDIRPGAMDVTALL